VPDGWTGFDVAFSHEVIYLLRDLAAHAASVYGALKTGGRYFASIGMHDRYPLIARWHRDLSRSIELPPVYVLDEVATALTAAGFDVAVTRFDLGFLPVAGHTQADAGTLDLATWCATTTRTRCCLARRDRSPAGHTHDSRPEGEEAA
jgi:hypothetical protein